MTTVKATDSNAESLLRRTAVKADAQALEVISVNRFKGVYATLEKRSSSAMDKSLRSLYAIVTTELASIDENLRD